MSIKIKKLVRNGVATQATQTAEIEALETAVGDSNSGLVKDVATLKTTVGDNDSGLVKGLSTLETTVGDAEAGLVKNVSDITAAIGDEETANSILGRIKALENAANSAETEPSS